jgi:hypothetical protein
MARFNIVWQKTRDQKSKAVIITRDQWSRMNDATVIIDRSEMKRRALRHHEATSGANQ